MAEVIPLTDRSEPLASRVRASAAGQDGRVFVLDCSGDAPGDLWSVWVAQASEQVLLRLAADARDGRRREPIVGVVKRLARPTTASAWRDAFELAAVEAVRGVLGSAALELAAEGVRANVILLDERTSAGDLERSVRYLLDERAAGFTTGVTIRLGAEGLGGSPGGASAAGAQRQSDAPRRALVTGAAGGIGFATAQAFAAAEYQVIASDVDRPRLEAAAARLGAVPLPLDVTDRQQLREVLQSEALNGGLQALVVAHGVAGARALRDLDRPFIQRNMAINGTAVAALVEELLPALERGAPSTIGVVASQAGIKAEPQNAAYCAAKFAVVGLVRGLAPLLLPRGVRIHALCPGCVDTPLLAAALDGFARASGIAEEEFRQRRAAGIPLRRFAAPDEMGAAMLFLCQLDQTGLVFAPSGGETLT